VEPSFIRALVDRMVVVSDVDSVAAMRVLSGLLGRRVGPSTGTNFTAMLALACEMRERGEQGAILSLLCDAGERYLPTYHDAAWVQQHMGDCTGGAAAHGGAGGLRHTMLPALPAFPRRSLLAAGLLGGCLPAAALPPQRRCGSRATTARTRAFAPSGGTSPGMPRRAGASSASR
jgi:hypothetical protein